MSPVAKAVAAIAAMPTQNVIKMHRKQTSVQRRSSMSCEEHVGEKKGVGAAMSEREVHRKRGMRCAAPLCLDGECPLSRPLVPCCLQGTHTRGRGAEREAASQLSGPPPSLPVQLSLIHI
eukprot:5216076-Prymnesium_polylepis.1